MDQNTDVSSQRYAPPVAEVADVAVDGITLAGRGSRLGAAVIDGVILLALLWLAGKVTPWNAFSPEFATMGFGSLLMMQLMSIALYLLVNGYLLATQGQSIGKKMLGMRIVRSDGSAAAIGRLIGLRYAPGFFIASIPVLGWSYSLADSLLIFRSSRKCLHDNIADTIVVKA